MKHMYITRKDILYRRTMFKAEAGMYAWAKPYTDANIDNVKTGLGGNFTYSPIFRSAFADTFIKLTGYRSKDYRIAEKLTGIIHTPKVTVWHHAWQEKNGYYRMQLVDFSEHKKTCPHAGGCRLWLMKNHKNKRYAAYRRRTSPGNYSDKSKFYLIDSNDRNYYQRGYVSKKTIANANRKKTKLIGIDIYGNLLYQNRTKTFFWDHECDKLISMGEIKDSKIIHGTKLLLKTSKNINITIVMGITMDTENAYSLNMNTEQLHRYPDYTNNYEKQILDNEYKSKDKQKQY